jgi:hypothetical protein
MLPWDAWGVVPHPGQPLDGAQLRSFDRVAALTHTPDAAFTELRALYEGDERLRVPATVRNALLNREEAVGAYPWGSAQSSCTETAATRHGLQAEND